MKNGQLVNPRGSPGYEEVVKVSANVAISPTTGGSSFYGVSGFTAGSGTSFSPYSSGTNYATLSQWGDFRLAKIRLTFMCQVGSGGDPLQIVAALDSTGNDVAGSGSATGAFNTIQSRQSAKLVVVSPSQFRPVSLVFTPKELQNRLWHPQVHLSASAPPDNWGVLVSSVCPASSVTVSMFIDWFFDVREPTLSGVLLGKEEDSVRERLERLAVMSFPVRRNELASGAIEEVRGSSSEVKCPCCGVATATLASRIVAAATTSRASTAVITQP